MITVSLSHHLAATRSGMLFALKKWEELPGKFPNLYQEQSPISHVANVETPVLILEGEEDTPHEAELYTIYLRALGKEVCYVLYKGAGHSLGEKHRKDYFERTLEWFRKYLDS